MQPLDDNFEYSRKRYGRGFQYFDVVELQKVNCKNKLKSIKSIAIPPMWNDVLISLKVDSKIVAVGRDAKGRKQYIYSEKWQLQQQKTKFNKLVEFAHALPAIRRTCRALLEEPKWPLDKVVALMVLILDESGIRIGNKRYSKENESYGLSTLRRRHLLESGGGSRVDDSNKDADSEDVNGEAVSFDFIGKSGKHRKVEIDEPELVQHIKDSAQLPGYNLFRYQENVDNKLTWSDVCSDDVNEFIKANMGDAFSSKDFRTWTGTCLAAEYYWETLADNNQNKRKKIVNIVVEKVAKTLGNTPTICREYYIHPIILAKIENQTLDTTPQNAENEGDATELSALECFVLDLIQKNAF
jgi:DNA topoisomerase-1